MSSSSIAIDAGSIGSSTHPLPYNLSQWISRHSSRLVPPVCNAMIHSAGCQFKVMLVGGPNVRRDFHVEDGEEWFYQIKGDMVLRIEDNGEFKDIVIQEGESYLLPANIPHSPQRLTDTIGLVIERERMPNEFDSLRWYCTHCAGATIVYQTRFRCVELGTQVKEAIEHYYANEEIRKCQKCGNIDAMPDKPAREKELLQVIANHKLLTASQRDAVYAYGKSWINRITHPAPLGLHQWINDNRSLLAPPVGNKMIYSNGTQFKVMVVGGPNLRTDYHIEAGEEWFYQLQGDMILKIVDHGGQFRDILIKEGEAFLLPANIPHSPQRFPNTIGLVIERQRMSNQPLRELDHIRWYCPNPSCREPLKTFTFYCEDLGTQLVPVIQRWYSQEMYDERKCKKCGAVDVKPDITKATTAEDAMAMAVAASLEGKK